VYKMAEEVGLEPTSGRKATQFSKLFS